MGAKGNFYVTQKRTEANTKTYGDEYHSRRDVKEMATKRKRTRSPPINPSRRKKAGMGTLLDVLTNVRLSRLI